MRSDLALAALASAAVPGMKPVAVAAIGPADDDSPEEHQQALVEDTTGRRWLVRAPLSPVAGARLQQHDELVRQLSRHVPFKVPAPVGYADVGPDGRAAVYPFVDGSPVDLRRVPAGPGLAAALARAVAAVHNIPRGAFEEQDVPVLDAAGCRQRLITQVDRAAETGRVPTGLLARWEEAFDAAPLWQFATTPVHGRFRGSTVLVTFTDDDAATGRVVAVTGWEEAAVSDPAVDLAELCAQASPQAWRSVLESYTLARAQRPDPYLHVRARLHAEVRALHGLAAAVAEDRADVVRRTEEALRRMDRLTEDDDALVPVTARGSTTPAELSRDPEDAGTAVSLEPEAVDVDEPTEGHPVSEVPAGADQVTPQEPDGDDVTMEVPVPDHLRAGSAGATVPASEAEPGQETGDVMRETPDAGDERGAAGDGDGPTADGEDDPEEDGGEDVQADPVEDAEAHAGEADERTRLEEDPEELDDEHRLTELYGMPAEPDDPARAADDRTTPPPAGPR
ncbi:phosphotransferase [Ornithinimicrobium sp. W1665]|uniref:phosphotransferase n=1 Tax=Ornithinimicrobium sp. W1665 TaxID=3416666 RepID=UPI003D6C1936